MSSEYPIKSKLLIKQSVHARSSNSKKYRVNEFSDKLTGKECVDEKC